MTVPDDLRSPEALDDPYAFFHRLRNCDPVHWSEASRAWILTSYDEVCSAFKDHVRLSSDRLSPLEARMSASQRAAMKQTFDLLRGWMVFRDPPAHGRLRDPVRRVFTPRRVERLRRRVQSIVNELLDEMAGQPCGELVSALAFPLPAIVIAELLGVPQADREKFKRWSTKLSGLVFGAVEREDRDFAAGEAAAEFTAYFEALIRRYEAEPGDNLISALIAARDEGDSLSPDQMVGACTMLLFAGHETTTTLIANGVARLLRHPDQLALLRSNPRLIASAVEEFLRYEGPVTVMVRHAARTHERGGHELAAGQRLYLAVAGANRDPAVFPDPDRFDITRDPNPHLGLGHGLHFCLGAALARLEAQIAVGSLVARFPGLRLASDRLDWHASIVGRGLDRVPLELSEHRLPTHWGR